MAAALTHFVSNVASVVVWALIGVILLLLADHIIDRVDPIHFDEEIRKGNVAAAIVMAALIIGVAIVIYGAMLPVPANPTA